MHLSLLHFGPFDFIEQNWKQLFREIWNFSLGDNVNNARNVYMNFGTKIQLNFTSFCSTNDESNQGELFGKNSDFLVDRDIYMSSNTAIHVKRNRELKIF